MTRSAEAVPGQLSLPLAGRLGDLGFGAVTWRWPRPGEGRSARAATAGETGKKGR